MHKIKTTPKLKLNIVFNFFKNKEKKVQEDSLKWQRDIKENRKELQFKGLSC